MPVRYVWVYRLAYMRARGPLDMRSGSRIMDIDVARVQDASYEAPHVECVLTTEELTREIQYAGAGTFIPDAAPGV